ncbi:MAG: NAD-dependent epimerase/dehydratase family protein [Beijerinckiaceae bacterium]|nr:NAD-dependent epimerase/dehydratase family protein [Beijerinckiaceae bacterium]
MRRGAHPAVHSPAADLARHGEVRAGPVAGRKCVVLGGGGFLGAHLVRRLTGAGADVTAFGRSLNVIDAIPGVRRVEGNFEDSAAFEAAVAGADIVYHLVSTTTPATAERDRLFDLTSNVCGTLALLDICRRQGIPRIVFPSSGGTVYGAAPDQVFSEETPPEPISAYGVSKFSIERYLALFNRQFGMRNVVLRISNPFGPLQYGRKNQGAIGIFARALLKGERVTIWGDGSAVRDYIYVDDVTEAFLKAGTYRGEHQVFNIGTGVGRSLNRVIAELERIAGLPLNRRYQPPRGFDVAVNVLNIERAAAELDWRPAVAWDDALARTLAWVRADLTTE